MSVAETDSKSSLQLLSIYVCKNLFTSFGSNELFLDCKNNSSSSRIFISILLLVSRELFLIKNSFVTLLMRRYTKELLQEICVRDKCTVDFDKIESYHSHAYIQFTCECGVPNAKKFQQITITNAYCKKCTLNQRNIKCKQTCLKKFGVENPFQSDEIKNIYIPMW